MIQKLPQQLPKLPPRSYCLRLSPLSFNSTYRVFQRVDNHLVDMVCYHRLVAQEALLACSISFFLGLVLLLPRMRF